MKEKVSIIGAGTAGLIAAKHLGYKGIETSVFDQKRIPGNHIVASGILSIKGLSTIGINYKRAITNTLYGANLHAGNRTMSIRTKEPIAHILDRKELNSICMEEAESAGAKMHLGKRVTSSKLNELNKTDIIIGADGAVSSVAKHFGMGAIEKYILTYKADYNINVPDEKKVDLFLDNFKYKGLFGWLAPNSKDILEVGVGLDPKMGNAKAVFEKFIRTEEISNIVGKINPINQGASIIPMKLRRRIADNKKEILLVGDAAGQVKATTGGGIIFGGNAAIMASQVINNHIKKNESLEIYREMFIKKYGLELKLHSSIARFYSSLSSKTFSNLFSMLNVLGVEEFLGRYGDMDRPSVILKRFLLRSLAS